MATVRLPAVTRILGAQGFYPQRMPEQFYLDRGSAAHKACELFDAGTLDRATVDEQISPFLVAHEKARIELNLKPLTPAVSELYIEGWPLGYAGKIDTAEWIMGWRTVVDWKCGNGSPDPTTLVQIASYRLLLAFHLQLPADRIRGASLHYHTDGTYRYNPYTQAQLDDGWHQFAAALMNYKWRRDHARLPDPKER